MATAYEEDCTAQPDTAQALLKEIQAKMASADVQIVVVEMCRGETNKG